MTAAITLRGVDKSFGARQVLRDLSLEVPSGELFGLVGPNGSGKTTLYRLLVGLSRADRGELTVLSTGAGSRSSRARIGYMTQSEALYEDLTVEENVSFFGQIFGLKGDALREATARAIRLVQLTDRVDSRVRTLSGGMRRRTSLACATVHGPDLLLLDEPTAGVDPELRGQFWAAFEAWCADGATVVIATHHLEEARRCHRLGLLRAGRFIAEGRPDDLIAEAGADTMEAAFLALARRAGVT